MGFNPISILSGGLISGSSPSTPAAPGASTAPTSTFTPGNYNFGNWAGIVQNSPNFGSNLNAQVGQPSVNALAPSNQVQLPGQVTAPQAPVGVSVPSVNMLAQQFNSATPRAM